MAWNNGLERNKFEKKQARLRKIYLKNGMTKQQCNRLYSYDNEVFLENRRHNEHNQFLELSAFDENKVDEGKNPLLDKFAESVSVNDSYWETGRYDWVKNIGDERLVKGLKKLKKDQLELLTLIFVKGYSQTEVALKYCVNHSTISRKLTNIKKILKTF